MTRIQKTLRLTVVTLTTFATVGAGLAVRPALGAGHQKNPGYPLLGQMPLPNANATDLFLRQDKQRHKYLYIVYADNTLSVLNVTNTGEITETRRLALTTSKATAHAEQVNASSVVLSNTPQPEQDVTVLDTSAPATPEIAKQFKNADCYTIDSNGDTLYVVNDAELSIVHFDRPVSRDAELFEQMLQNR
jgi:hypothetical protein